MQTGRLIDSRIMPPTQPAHFQPLGDQAVLAHAATENAAAGFAEQVRRHCFTWVVDVVQAYTTVAVFYDLERTDYCACRAALAELPALPSLDNDSVRTHTIPCCYELGLDLERVAEAKRLSVPRVIELHARREYTVYAIGFCPGFPYLGYLPEELAGVSRLPSPRLQVLAGSVGMTGRQTGIYTEARPGGWNIVGRTPLQLVDVKTAYFPLRTGDRVRFEAISEAEFEKLDGKRL